jgi:hypothetical protein
LIPRDYTCTISTKALEQLQIFSKIPNAVSPAVLQTMSADLAQQYLQMWMNNEIGDEAFQKLMKAAKSMGSSPLEQTGDALYSKIDVQLMVLLFSNQTPK